MTFSKHYSNWSVHGEDHLNIAYVDSTGDTLDELLDNAEIYVETWHGGEGPQWTAGDLPTKDYVALTQEFKAFLEA